MKTDAPTLAGALRDYAMALFFVALSTGAGLVMAPRWGTSAVDLIYLPAVLATAVLAGFGPAIVAAITAALAYNYFFTAPFHTFLIHHPADIVTVIVLFLVALVTSRLAASIRTQAQIAQAHANRNATIAGFARHLLQSSGEADISALTAKELARLFDCNCIILMPRPALTQVAAFPSMLTLTPSDVAVAALVLASGEATGRGIAPAMAVEWQFHPVRAGERTIAVVGLARDDGAPAVVPERRTLLDSLLDQMALALERSRFETEARDSVALRERDQVRTTLLSSIGRDLAPRFDSIVKTVDGLRRAGSADKELLADLRNETAQLQRYLGNLVDIAPDADQRPVEVGSVTIDLFRRSVTRDGAAAHLTPKEYAVLAELAKHPGRVLSHAQLLRAAWGPAQEKQTEYLRVAIRALRNKLEADPANPVLIVNEPAVGYRLAV